VKFMVKTVALAAFSTAAIVLSAVESALAADFSFRGTFTNDNDVQLFNFVVGTSSNVTLRTLSYAGGTQADGTVVPRGGFDPILSLFDSSGNLLDSDDDGSDVVDPTTGLSYDTLIEQLLNPGNYTVAVTQFNNFASGLNLANGFDQDGNPNFANGFDNGSRTNAWAFDVLNVDQAVIPDAAVPTPALLPALLGMGAAALRKRKGTEQEGIKA
jgi:hypothetical protein